jgi:glycosyltransferase involved in cell wall biosynthesis
MMVLFLCPYPTGVAPSQRFRFEQYFDLLHDKGFSFEVQPFLAREAWEGLYEQGHLWLKLRSLIMGFSSRMALLFRLQQFDFIFIHREVTPAGPPFFEWIIAKVFRKKVIYDFDDAIWTVEKKQSSINKTLKFRSKVNLICKWSTVISCGNQYLADYAERFSSRVVVNPTTVDVRRLHNPALYQKPINNFVTIGWTGSHSTLPYLEGIFKPLKAIEEKYNSVRFLVIADTAPNLPLKNLVFKKWSKETEISHLSEIDIGVMPLTDDEWTRGKGGFKALQYMAMEIPALLSPVGINTEIVQDGVHGYYCASDDQWFERLEQLIIDKELRSRMGREGRQKIIRDYSLDSNSATFLSLFHS